MEIIYNLEPTVLPRSGPVSKYADLFAALDKAEVNAWLAVKITDLGPVQPPVLCAAIRKTAKIPVQALKDGELMFVRKIIQKARRKSSSTPSPPATKNDAPHPRQASATASVTNPPTDPGKRGPGRPKTEFNAAHFAKQVAAHPIAVVAPTKTPDSSCQQVAMQQIDTLLTNLMALNDPDEWLWIKLPDRSRQASDMSQVRVSAKEKCLGFKVELDLDDDDTLYVRLLPAPVQ